jgi:hypothetical protein
VDGTDRYTDVHGRQVNVVRKTLRAELRRHARAALEVNGSVHAGRDQLCRQIVAAALVSELAHPSSIAYQALEELVDIALADEEILLLLDEIA